MAISKCIKCGGTIFELREANIQNARYKMYFVQCSSCGGVVGAIPFYDPGIEAHQVNEKIDKVKSALDDISYDIDYIKAHLNQL